MIVDESDTKIHGVWDPPSADWDNPNQGGVLLDSQIWLSKMQDYSSPSEGKNPPHYSVFRPSSQPDPKYTHTPEINTNITIFIDRHPIPTLFSNEEKRTWALQTMKWIATGYTIQPEEISTEATQARSYSFIQWGKKHYDKDLNAAIQEEEDFWNSHNLDSSPPSIQKDPHAKITMSNVARIDWRKELQRTRVYDYEAILSMYIQMSMRKKSTEASELEKSVAHLDLFNGNSPLIEFLKFKDTFRLLYQAHPERYHIAWAIDKLKRALGHRLLRKVGDFTFGTGESVTLESIEEVLRREDHKDRIVAGIPDLPNMAPVSSTVTPSMTSSPTYASTPLPKKTSNTGQESVVESRSAFAKQGFPATREGLKHLSSHEKKASEVLENKTRLGAGKGKESSISMLKPSEKGGEVVGEGETRRKGYVEIIFDVNAKIHVADERYEKYLTNVEEVYVTVNGGFVSRKKGFLVVTIGGDTLSIEVYVVPREMKLGPYVIVAGKKENVAINWSCIGEGTGRNGVTRYPATAKRPALVVEEEVEEKKIIPYLSPIVTEATVMIPLISEGHSGEVNDGPSSRDRIKPMKRGHSVTDRGATKEELLAGEWEESDTIEYKRHIIGGMLCGAIPKEQEHGYTITPLTMHRNARVNSHGDVVSKKSFLVHSDETQAIEKDTFRSNPNADILKVILPLGLRRGWKMKSILTPPTLKSFCSNMQQISNFACRLPETLPPAIIKKGLIPGGVYKSCKQLLEVHDNYSRFCIYVDDVAQRLKYEKVYGGLYVKKEDNLTVSVWMVCCTELLLVSSNIDKELADLKEYLEIHTANVIDLKPGAMFHCLGIPFIRGDDYIEVDTQAYTAKQINKVSKDIKSLIYAGHIISDDELVSHSEAASHAKVSASRISAISKIQWRLGLMDCKIFHYRGARGALFNAVNETLKQGLELENPRVTRIAEKPEIRIWADALFFGEMMGEHYGWVIQLVDGKSSLECVDNFIAWRSRCLEPNTHTPFSGIMKSVNEALHFARLFVELAEALFGECRVRTFVDSTLIYNQLHNTIPSFYGRETIDADFTRKRLEAIGSSIELVKGHDMLSNPLITMKKKSKFLQLLPDGDA